MTRAKKEQFKDNVKLFYMTTIESKGYFDYNHKEWLFLDACHVFGISFRTARRYFWRLVPREFLVEYEI